MAAVCRCGRSRWQASLWLLLGALSVGSVPPLLLGVSGSAISGESLSLEADALAEDEAADTDSADSSAAGGRSDEANGGDSDVEGGGVDVMDGAGEGSEAAALAETSEGIQYDDAAGSAESVPPEGYVDSASEDDGSDMVREPGQFSDEAAAAAGEEGREAVEHQRRQPLAHSSRPPLVRRESRATQEAEEVKQRPTAAAAGNRRDSRANVALLEHGGAANATSELEKRAYYLAAHANSRVEAAAGANPLSEFSFDGNDTWTKWPGLSRTITLASNRVVLVQYQTASFAKDSHMLSRLLIDGVDTVDGRSAQGNTKYASTFGLYVGHLPKGQHTFDVEYRTSSVDNVFAQGGDYWQTRALNLISLPEAEANIVNPSWPFTLSSTGDWMEWQGLQTNVDLQFDMPVLCFYTAVVAGNNAFMASKLYIDDQEQKESRSVAGSNTLAQNSGFWAGTVSQGQHAFSVKYRTAARKSKFLENDWMARALNVIELPRAKVYSVYSDAFYKTVPNDVDNPWLGLQKELTAETDQYVLAMYSVSLRSHSDKVQAGSITSALRVNGEQQTQTRSRCGDVKYCQLTGMYIGVMPPGTHQFDVTYRTSHELQMDEGSGDYMNRALFVIALSNVATQVALLQKSEEILPLDGHDASSFLDLGATLQGIREVERKVYDGSASKELMEKLKARGIELPILPAGAAASAKRAAH
eukprot:TRINITY_DN44619_c0_g1_i1.p1 TRINITY_DN44619_c0_g1~~TRINITY_DN44619_c0_g1_i1.p1  ORF type:complete len:699 (+),score=196.35 TRINITY_DN44619_c0_g1_i1:141-2237(+)